MASVWLNLLVPAFRKEQTASLPPHDGEAPREPESGRQAHQLSFP